MARNLDVDTGEIARSSNFTTNSPEDPIEVVQSIPSTKVNNPLQNLTPPKLLSPKQGKGDYIIKRVTRSKPELSIPECIPTEQLLLSRESINSRPSSTALYNRPNPKHTKSYRQAPPKSPKSKGDYAPILRSKKGSVEIHLNNSASNSSSLPVIDLQLQHDYFNLAFLHNKPSQYPKHSLSERISLSQIKSNKLIPSFSSVRSFQFSSDALFEAIGIGYLEHLCRASTSASILHSFIQSLTSAQALLSPSQEFQNAKDLLLSVLTILLNKKKYGEHLTQQLEDIISHPDFMTAYTILLKELTAHQMAVNDLSEYSSFISTGKNPSIDIMSNSLGKALNVLISIHNLDAGNSKEYGGENSECVIHIVVVWNNREFIQLLYFRYQEEEDSKQIPSDREFTCLKCGQLPHHCYFPKDLDRCCRSCSVVQEGSLYDPYRLLP